MAKPNAFFENIVLPASSLQKVQDFVINTIKIVLCVHKNLNSSQKRVKILPTAKAPTLHLYLKQKKINQ